MRMREDTIMVGLGDVEASAQPGKIIKTLALGSCVSVVAIAPKRRAVGMVHVVLPDSSIDTQKAGQKPGYFADTGIPALLESFARLNVSNPRELVVKLVGGANVMDPNNTFNIGKRNVLICRKVLWKHRLAAIAEDVGGTLSRTVWVEVDSGRVFIQSPGRGKWEI